MRKRFAVKLAVTLTGLSALALLPGCGDEESFSTLSYAWGPVGSSLLMGFGFETGLGTVGGTPSTGGSAGGTVTATTGGGG